jgi:serine/threonine-protein kinase RsbT
MKALKPSAQANGSSPATDGRTVLRTEADIVAARMIGRQMATQLGFSPGDSTLIATAISELARNVVQYARQGEVVFAALSVGGRCGIAVTVTDEGPGIHDVDAALQDGYSTSGRLGLGLPGVRRLMDELAIDSTPGHGTTVKVKKWKR